MKGNLKYFAIALVILNIWALIICNSGSVKIVMGSILTIGLFGIGFDVWERMSKLDFNFVTDAEKRMAKKRINKEAVRNIGILLAYIVIMVIINKYVIAEIVKEFSR